MNITVGNNIYVDGKYMRAKDIEPEHFRQVLVLGREAINLAIDKTYQKTLQWAAADYQKTGKTTFVQPGHVRAILLGRYSSDILSKKRNDEIDVEGITDSIVRNAQDLNEKFGQYWEIAEQEGYYPGIQDSTSPDKATNGCSLTVRTTPHKPVPDDLLAYSGELAKMVLDLPTPIPKQYQIKKR